MIIPATIKAVSPRLEVRAGNNAEMTCIASGDPMPMVTWTTPGRGRDKTVSNTTVIHVNSVTREDAGK